MWRHQAEAASREGWRVLTPDLPGFGGTITPDSAPSLDVVADAVVAYLSEQGVASCTVGGISLGGYLSMNLARRHPDVVEALILCDTKATADSPEAQAGRARLARLCEDDPGNVGRVLEQAILPGLLGETTRQRRPGVVEEVRGYLNCVDAQTVAWYQRAMAGRPDSRESLAAFPGASLIIWGEEDTLSPRAEQDLMRQALGGSDLIAVEGAGHLSALESPEAVSAAMVAFLRGCDPRKD